MTVAFQSDLRAMCRQPMGVPVTFAGVSAYANDGSPVCGLLDRPVEFKLQDSGIEGVETPLPTLQLPCDAFSPMPRSGDRITVGGVVYVVDQPSQEDDGGFYTYALSLP